MGPRWRGDDDKATSRVALLIDCCVRLPSLDAAAPRAEPFPPTHARSGRSAAWASHCYFTASDGIRIHYTIDDFAPPWKPRDTVLLLHAAMGSMNRMYAWVPILAAHYRVVRWDMRGHGLSQIPAEGGLSIERLGRDVVEMLDTLGVPQAHLAGSSAGGIVALFTAIADPQRVKTLAGFATIPGLQSSAGHTDYTSWVQGLVTEGVKPFLRRTIATRFDLAQVERRVRRMVPRRRRAQ